MLLLGQIVAELLLALRLLLDALVDPGGGWGCRQMGLLLLLVVEIGWGASRVVARRWRCSRAAPDSQLQCLRTG